MSDGVGLASARAMELSLELEALLALLESPRAPPLLAWRPVACGDDAPGALVQEAVFDLPAPPAAGGPDDGLPMDQDGAGNDYL